MKNKELLLRRMRTLEGMLKRTRTFLNQRDVESAKKEINAILELKEDIDSIIEREN